MGQITQIDINSSLLSVSIESTYVKRTYGIEKMVFFLTIASSVDFTVHIKEALVQAQSDYSDQKRPTHCFTQAMFCAYINKLTGLVTLWFIYLQEKYIPQKVSGFICFVFFFTYERINFPSYSAYHLALRVTGGERNESNG